MATDALAALLFGRLFDRYGFAVIVAATAVSLFFTPLVYTGTLVAAIIGMILWGTGMGVQVCMKRAAP